MLHAAALLFAEMRRLWRGWPYTAVISPLWGDCDFALPLLKAVLRCTRAQQGTAVCLLHSMLVAADALRAAEKLLDQCAHPCRDKAQCPSCNE